MLMLECMMQSDYASIQISCDTNTSGISITFLILVCGICKTHAAHQQAGHEAYGACDMARADNMTANTQQ